MIQYNYRIARLGIVLLDLATVIISYFVAIETRNSVLPDIYNRIDYLDFPALFIGFNVLWSLLLLIYDATRTVRFESVRKEIFAGLIINLIGLAIIFSLAFVSKRYYPRSFIIAYGLVFSILYLLQKWIVYQFINHHRKNNPVHVLIIGAGEKATIFSNEIRTKNKRFQIVGYLAQSAELIGKKIFYDHCIIGSYQDLADILKSYAINEVFFLLPHEDYCYLDSCLAVCAEVGLTSHVLFNPRRISAYKTRVDVITGKSMITYFRIPENDMQLLIKRLLDIIISFFALAILAPVFLVIAVIIKLTSKGPIFYPWKVVGQNNHPFTGYKFRTMVVDADQKLKELAAKNEMNGPVFKIKDDPRITTIGKFLRKYSLDELPQLWSVFKGDMSLVGPRPPGQHEIGRFEFWQRRKISFKPGITCLWQVEGRNQITDFNDWCRMDLEYIDNWSLWLDFKILVRTAWVMIKGTGY